MTSGADPLSQRYGAASPGRRIGVIALAAVVAAGSLGWLIWAMLFHSNPAVSSTQLGYEVVDDHTATTRIQIKYGDGPVEATCSVRAISPDKAIVGELKFTPDPAEGPVHDVEVQTERRATTVDWIGCTAPGQSRPR